MEFLRPRGDATTVIDQSDRDGQDDAFFPLTADISWFSRDTDRRTINFAPEIQTFQYKGNASYGGRMTFELGRAAAGDLIHMIGLQVKLGHWLDPGIRQQLEAATKRYQDPTSAWTYANGIGRILVQSAEFEVDDTTLERIDYTAADIIMKLYPDLNTIFGFGRDGVGYATHQELIETPSTNAIPNGMFDPQRPFTTEKGELFCLIPFFFTRNPYKASFPLLATAEGKARVHIQLAPFENIVRAVSGQRASCTDTPLNKQFTFTNTPATPPTTTVTTAATPPLFSDIRLIVYSSILGNEVRQPYIRNPFEIMYRELGSFPFSEPLKYVASKTVSGLDTVQVQLPLEANHPVEEILWVVRRKAQAINNDWLNYSSYTEKQYSADLIPQGPVVDAAIYVNGQSLVHQSGDWFRAHIASKHKGGIVAYNSYIYGYSFALTPGRFTPSGTANMSRAQSLRLDLTVRVPTAATVPAGFDETVSQLWEVNVYTVGINWLRFQNGLCGRVFTA
jgi:hypothetical protein